MPDPDKMIAAVHAYVAAFEASNVDQVVALFAPEATVEDPVGSHWIQGAEAIREFYSKNVGARLVLDGPVRVAKEHAAFPFTVFAEIDGKEIRVEVIDTFRFNDANQVVEMKAYFGPVNFHANA